MTYSLGIGIWKSIKNLIIVLAPAVAAGWATFSANLPTEYQAVAAVFASFVVYLFKNYIENR